MTPDEIVEAVARAMCDCEWEPGRYDSPKMSEAVRDDYRKIARAAVAAYEQLVPSASIRALIDKDQP
jgi:hypothetical protein